MGIFTMGKLLHIKSNYMSGPTARLKRKKKGKNWQHKSEGKVFITEANLRWSSQMKA